MGIRTMRSLLPATLFVLLLAPAARATDQPRITMLVDVEGRKLEGRPLAWSRNQAFLLGRDGQLWNFAPNRARNARKTSSSFTSYSASEMRSSLERELAGKLVVTGTGHYLVAHPPGKEAWAQRFEELYRSCTHYFNLRGMRVNEPEFPLVAIVWGKQDQFLRFASMQGAPVSSNVLGFYSPTTNRCTLYDQGGGTATQRMWQETDATIIHEATHQMAFNTGVHNRFGLSPKWMVEGLGTMFEAKGVWNWLNYPNRSDRIARDRLAQFRHWQKHGRATGDFFHLVGSDRQFNDNPSAAYAESWAWVFFLTETYPHKFGEYVRRVAARPDFEDYPLAKRLADFQAVFTLDPRILEKHFLDFMASLGP